MMVPFQLRRSPSRRGKTAAERCAKSSAYPPRCPFWRASIATLQADGPFSPFWRRPGHYLLAGQPLRLCGENIDQPLALWQPWAFPGEWRMGAVQRRYRCARAGLQYHDSARARRRQFRSLATCNALPARGSLMFYKASGIWSGDAARPAAACCAVDPRESASRGQQWTPAAGGDRALK